MAEAAVEENLAEPPSSKFFCHKCNVELSRVLDDFTCPTCLGGFIEELLPTTPGTDDADDSSDDDDDDMGDDLLSHVNEMLFGLGAERDRGARTLRNLTGAPVPAAARRGRVPRGEREYEPFEHVIQDFIVNLTGVGWAPAGHGQGRGGGGPVRFLIGNPGDYAWGREGLDAIVTQLLNQMDVAGPPPLDKDKIKEIPSLAITQEQATAKLQCSVCWEDFQVGESVRKLQCEHFYHSPCIVPWLELHGTCPICRKSLSGVSDENASEHAPHLPDLPWLRGRWSSASPSTSATSTNTSSSRRDRPPSESEMDFEFD